MKGRAEIRIAHTLEKRHKARPIFKKTLHDSGGSRLLGPLGAGMATYDQQRDRFVDFSSVTSFL